MFKELKIMTNDVQMYSYKDKKVITHETNNEVWFAAIDICDALGLSNSRKAVKSLDDDEKMTVTFSYGHSNQRGGLQFMTFVNEPGLYKLIFKSKKQEAKEFTRWITHEVLPQIRKNGMYISNNLLLSLRQEVSELR